MSSVSCGWQSTIHKLCCVARRTQYHSGGAVSFLSFMIQFCFAWLCLRVLDHTCKLSLCTDEHICLCTALRTNQNRLTSLTLLRSRGHLVNQTHVSSVSCESYYLWLLRYKHHSLHFDWCDSDTTCSYCLMFVFCRYFHLCVISHYS